MAHRSNPCLVWLTSGFLFQGGNDYEIFESEKTIGHTGELFFSHVIFFFWLVGGGGGD